MGARKLILVVDDHADIRQLIKLTLSKHYEIAESESGDAALLFIQARVPDLVILDVMMPGGIDGIGVLDAIRARTDCSATKVIMVTARGQANDYQLGMHHGADAYFIKPFSPLLLSRSVNDMLGNAEADPTALAEPNPLAPKQ